MLRLLLIALFFEVGLVLMVIPWSVYWDRNYFTESIPVIHEMITNPFVRGAVSGLGLVNFCVAVFEVVSILGARRLHDPIISIRQSSPLED